jgi:hypothetical protein
MLGVIPLAISSLIPRVEFNQILLERARVKNCSNVADCFLRAVSLVAVSWNAGIRQSMAITEGVPDYNASDDMFEFVMRHVPSSARVFPTRPVSPLLI